ncbi:MAG: ABC transporter permease subunit [Acidobacteria bacterium]|nr:ABC transporter permease subunit [Acidobacteriota bacterium]
MNFQKVYAVARREYIARVRNKWFVIITLLFPVLMAAPVFIGSLIQRADVDEVRIAIVDVGTGQASAIQAEFETIESFALTISGSETLSASEYESRRESMRQAVLDEEIDGYVLIEPDEELGIRGRYLARETGNLVILGTLENRVRRVALENYLAGSGLETDRVNALVSWDLETTTISAEGDEDGGFERAYFTTFILAMVLYITVLMAGQQMGNSIIEEKSSRLIELVLGAVTAAEFMAGKILGVLSTALTQLAAWFGLVMLISLYIMPALAIGSDMGDLNIMEFFDAGLLFYFTILFLLGYVFYSVLYAVAASTCSTMEDFQQMAFPLMMPVMLSFFFVFYVITNPAATISRIVSLFPPATPLVMLARINVLRPPLWEIWLGIGLLVLATIAAVWVSAKVFRFTLLMSGKRPSIGTMVRMFRAA